MGAGGGGESELRCKIKSEVESKQKARRLELWRKWQPAELQGRQKSRNPSAFGRSKLCASPIRVFREREQRDVGLLVSS